MTKNSTSAPRSITAPEMRKILSYAWAHQFFSTKGDAARAFESQKCAACRNSDGAAQVDPYSAVRMVSVLWKHGPTMEQRMQQNKISWPKLSPGDMSNLGAYLNTR